MFIMSLFANAQEKLSAWRRRHQAYTGLMALDDRSLADIGIHRSQIPGLVFGGQEKARDFDAEAQGGGGQPPPPPAAATGPRGSPPRAAPPIAPDRAPSAPMAGRGYWRTPD